MGLEALSRGGMSLAVVSLVSGTSSFLLTLARSLVVLVAVLVLALPSVRHLDLCMCEGSDHGLFCAESSDSAGCCEGRADESEECPGCPSIELSTKVLLGVPSQAEELLLGAQPAPADATSRQATFSPETPRIEQVRPPPRSVRLHVSHCVFLL